VRRRRFVAHRRRGAAPPVQPGSGADVRLPARHAAEEDAIIIAAPDVDINRFRDAFTADPAARNRLRGGSVTTNDRTLILVAGNGDLDVARRIVAEAGGSLEAATIAYGRREFVE